MSLFTGDRFVDVDVKYPAIQQVIDDFNEQALPYKKDVEVLEQIAQYDDASAKRAQELISRVSAAKQFFINKVNAAESRAKERETKARKSVDGLAE